MEIKVYGPGCAKCEETDRIVRQVIKDLDIAATVEKVSDLKEMMGLGIMSTPAVAIDGKVVSTGHVPSKDEIKDWLSGKGSVASSGGDGCCCCGGKC